MADDLRIIFSFLRSRSWCAAARDAWRELPSLWQMYRPLCQALVLDSVLGTSTATFSIASARRSSRPDRQVSPAFVMGRSESHITNAPLSDGFGLSNQRLCASCGGGFPFGYYTRCTSTPRSPSGQSSLIAGEDMIEIRSVRRKTVPQYWQVFLSRSKTLCGELHFLLRPPIESKSPSRAAPDLPQIVVTTSCRRVAKNHASRQIVREKIVGRIRRDPCAWPW